MYTYLLGISHEIHSSESTYIKPSEGTIPLEAFSDFYLQKAKAIEKRGRKLVPHADGICEVIRTRYSDNLFFLSTESEKYSNY
jgi:hypothetical protein